VSDSFETPEGAFEMDIVEYKQDGSVTNWVSANSNRSTIVSNEVAYTGIRPIDGATTNLILNLDKAGTSLSRAITNKLDIEDAPVYVDTLIQFTPSMTEPVIMPDFKIALYVNAQSNLVVIHNVYTDPVFGDIEGRYSDYTQIETNSIIDLEGDINPDQWYRLSTKVEKNIYGDRGTKIWLDGAPLSSPLGFDANANTNGGTLFIHRSNLLNINVVSFNGIGALDEFVVSDTKPSSIASTVVHLRLVSAGTGYAIFTVDGETIAEGSEVTDGTEVTISAPDWYRITDISGAFTNTLATLLPSSVAVETLLTDASCGAVTATVELISGSTTVGDKAYSNNTIKSWADIDGVSEADFSNYEGHFLLNISTSAVAEISIELIVIVDTNITAITVGPTNSVNFADLNGMLILRNSSDLVAWEVPAEMGVTAEVVTVTNGLKFIKAIVE